MNRPTLMHEEPKKELAAVQSLVAHGSTVKDACRVAGIP